MQRRRKLQNLLSFIRWRLIPIRYLTMLLNLNWSLLLKKPQVKSKLAEEINNRGVTNGPHMPLSLVTQAREIYSARVSSVVAPTDGHPFVNLFADDDITPNNPVMRFAFSREVLDLALDYFGGKIILDSIQVLYSFRTDGALRESQHWHLDFNDRKSLHCVTYLNDVLTPADGPFVYVDKRTSKKIGRRLIVRRIDDEVFDRELRGGNIETFYGKSGSSIIIDPACCYHFGSRCANARYAVFVTFSSWFPFVLPTALVKNNSARIIRSASIIRPDLNEKFLRTLLRSN